MFDIGWDEMLFTAIIAIVVIGPKDLPRALRTAGRWMGKVRRVSGHFRTGIETMIREAELEDMEKKWREQNEAIMKAHPASDLPEEPIGPDPGMGDPPIPPTAYPDAPEIAASADPQLPLPPEKAG